MVADPECLRMAGNGFGGFLWPVGLEPRARQASGFFFRFRPSRDRRSMSR
jgi:hypothetical protein